MAAKKTGGAMPNRVSNTQARKIVEQAAKALSTGRIKSAEQLPEVIAPEVSALTFADARREYDKLTNPADEKLIKTIEHRLMTAALVEDKAGDLSPFHIAAASLRTAETFITAHLMSRAEASAARRERLSSKARKRRRSTSTQ